MFFIANFNYLDYSKTNTDKKKAGVYMTVKESGIAEIYTKNTDTFSVGRVFCQNNECVVFEDIDTQGKITGYYVIKKEIISRLEYDTEYLNKIGKYMEYNENHSYSEWFSLKPVALNTEKSLIFQVLQYALDNDMVITIETDNKEAESGYVKEIENGMLTFACLDISNAQPMENITVAIHDIILIEFESIDNVLLQYANAALNISS